MRQSKLLQILLIAALALVSGCQSLGESLQPPEVRLQNVQLEEVSSLSQRFVLQFAVSNPNPVPLPVKGINYGVSLGGLSLASGSTAESFRVPSNGDGVFSVSVETSLMQAVQLLGARLLQGGEQSLDYEVGGDVQIDIPFVKPLPFSTAGKVTIGR